MFTGCVYIVFNSVTGSAYIGKALKGLNHRKRQHFQACRRGEDWAFYRAMRKHGEDAFSRWDVLFFSDDNDALLEAERAAISAHRDAGLSLYNSTDGGEGTSGRLASLECRRKISEKAKHRRPSPATKAKIGAAGRGIVRSPEFRANLAEAKRRYWADRSSRGLGGHAHVMTEEGRRALSENATRRWERWRGGDTACIGKTAGAEGSKALARP